MTPSETEEIKRHFDVVAEDLRTEIFGLAGSLSRILETLERRFSALEDEMREGFGETRALLVIR